MAFCWGWPKALATGSSPLDDETVACFASGEYVIAVFSATLQVWSGGQHRLKLGELHRTLEALEEEGANLRAHWCPQKRVLAVVTERNHLQLYALNVSSEALWRLPGGGDVRRVNLYLSHSIHLDYGTVHIADVGGDAKSLLVALTNGTMQVFSWQGKLRGQANPFIAAYEGSRSRLQRGMSRLSGSSGALGSARNSLSLDSLAGPANGADRQFSGVLGAASTGRGSVDGGDGATSALLAAMSALDLPQPTPVQPADVAVSRIHYAPAARLLAVVLADGRCALCRTADSGIHPVDQVQLLRWVHKPAGPAAPAVVAAALNPAAQLLALGMSHGRVAIYTLHSLLSSRHHHQHMRSSSSAASLRAPQGDAPPSGGGGGGGAGQPEPTRVLSLADWGYRSSMVGPAAVLQWSPDGRVLAVGYGKRGMAVWTPSGCRLMCSLRQAVATAAPPAPGAAAQLNASTPGRPEAVDGQATQQQPEGKASAGELYARRSSTDGSVAAAPSSPGKRVPNVPGGLWSQTSNLNPSQAPEAGVLEGGVGALAWTADGYQLLVAEREKPSALHQLEFARHVHGAHRVVQPWAAASGGGSGGGGGLGIGHEELHALQAADRVLLITENRQSGDPALRVPAGLPGAAAGEQGDGDAGGARPDLLLQHVKLPQQYIDAAYPLRHAAISQDRADVAVAGTRGLAVYSRRARRWRLFGDASQERGLRVQGLMWLPGGVIAAVAHVDVKEGSGAPQLLLYPQYHLDNASLLARLPLKQAPVAMDSSGWHMVLAFQPLEIKLFKVAVEGPLGPAGRPIARLSAVRELSIMGMCTPLQDIALIDPASLAHSGPRAAGSSQPSLQQQEDGSGAAEAATASSRAGAATAAAGALPSTGGAADADLAWPQLSVATKPAAAPADAPLQCVLLRAGGVMSKLDLEEGSELLLSDAIERFWLPVSPAAAGGSGPVSRTNSFTAAGGVAPGGAGLTSEGSLPASISTSSSTAALGRGASDMELAGSAAAQEGQQGSPETAPAELAAQQAQQGQPPLVEMPWWTYGPRGMQLWFPSSLSEPLTPSARTLSLASPTATGLAAAAAAAANSTDPELEFDREVYPIGVSLAEVSIVGVMQRTVRSPAFPPQAAQSLCFHPLPESQPVLPCLLRRLLQKGRQEEALELARWHSTGPHFNRSLEWLLFTALELDAEQQHTGSSAAPAHPRHRFNSSYAVTLNSMQADPQQQPFAHEQQQQGKQSHPGFASPRGAGAAPAPAPAQRHAGPLLVAAARLISQFPQFPEIVVSVARKTDAALWPALFAAVGSPGALCQGLLQADKLQAAACCLVIVEQIEGGARAQAQALQLIDAALSGGQYGLAADLLRFLVPPGEAEALLESPGGRAEGPAVSGSELALPPSTPGSQVQRQQGGDGEPAAASAAQAAAQQQQQAPEPDAPQQQQQGGASWFWGLFGGASSSEPPAAASSQQVQGSGAAEQETAGEQQRQQQAQQQAERQGGEEGGVAAGEAWRLMGMHAWKLLDAGALREAAQLARSLAGLHGGLPALLSATAAEAPGAQGHVAPSAAAIASALFVATNEFASAEQEGDAGAAAELLMAACQEAGCVNLAAALALLLGDQQSLLQFSAEHPAAWAELHTLIANDVHLCGYAPVLSPLPSPVIGPGGPPAGALLSPGTAAA